MSKTRMLPVKLNDAEVLERSAMLVELMGKRDEAEDAKKASAAAFKSKIEDLDEKIGHASDVVRHRREERPVEVIESFSTVERVVREIRIDTQEIVSTRPMTVAELQEHEQRKLPFDPPDEPAKAKA